MTTYYVVKNDVGVTIDVRASSSNRHYSFALLTAEQDGVYSYAGTYHLASKRMSQLPDGAIIRHVLPATAAEYKAEKAAMKK